MFLRASSSFFFCRKISAWTLCLSPSLRAGLNIPVNLRSSTVSSNLFLITFGDARLLTTEFFFALSESKMIYLAFFESVMGDVLTNMYSPCLSFIAFGLPSLPKMMRPFSSLWSKIMEGPNLITFSLRCWSLAWCFNFRSSWTSSNSNYFNSSSSLFFVSSCTLTYTFKCLTTSYWSFNITVNCFNSYSLADISC